MRARPRHGVSVQKPRLFSMIIARMPAAKARASDINGSGTSGAAVIGINPRERENERRREIPHWLDGHRKLESAPPRSGKEEHPPGGAATAAFSRVGKPRPCGGRFKFAGARKLLASENWNVCSEPNKLSWHLHSPPRNGERSRVG